MSPIRHTVDYALVRNTLLGKLATGLVRAEEICDADRYLLSAAKYHGVAQETRCPVCREHNVFHVSWVYGQNLRDISGSARSETEILALASRFAEFTVHVVEVCCHCRWNHLQRSYRIGRMRKSRSAR